MKNSKLFPFVCTAMLSAVGFTLMFVEFPLLLSVPYLKMDFSDLPCFIAAVLFGPVYGVISELLKNVLDLIIKGFGSQMGFGNVMNFAVGCAYILPFAIILRKLDKSSSFKKLATASIVSLSIMLVIGFFGNYIFAPLFFRFFLNSPLTVKEALGAAIISLPFNAIKASILSAIIILIYKPLITKLNNQYNT